MLFRSDIDLAGGTSATMILKKPLGDGDVRRMLGETFENLKDSGAPGRIDYTVYEITFKGRDPRTVYQVLSNIPKVEVLQKAIQETFRNDDGSEGLLTYQLEVGNLKPVTRASDAPNDTTGAAPGGPGEHAAKGVEGVGLAHALPTTLSGRSLPNTRW